MNFRCWIGLWTASILLIMVVTDASYLVKYITRFTGSCSRTIARANEHRLPFFRGELRRPHWHHLYLRSVRQDDRDQQTSTGSIAHHRSTSIGLLMHFVFTAQSNINDDHQCKRLSLPVCIEPCSCRLGLLQEPDVRIPRAKLRGAQQQDVHSRCVLLLTASLRLHVRSGLHLEELQIQSLSLHDRSLPRVVRTAASSSPIFRSVRR